MRCSSRASEGSYGQRQRLGVRKMWKAVQRSGWVIGRDQTNHFTHRTGDDHGDQHQLIT